jgi:serine/threonine protein kinase
MLITITRHAVPRELIECIDVSAQEVSRSSNAASLQDLLKRLLQKDPNKRISFRSFFEHPFLSDRPLVTASPIDATHEIIVEEPTAPHGGAAVEEDYVILSIPTPPTATAQSSTSVKAASRQTGTAAGPSVPGTSGDQSITQSSTRWPSHANPWLLQQSVSQQERSKPPLVQQWMLMLPEHLNSEEALFVAALSVAELAGAAP